MLFKSEGKRWKQDVLTYFVIVCFSMLLCAAQTRGLWNASILHSCLACLCSPCWNLFHHSFIHSFIRHWCPLREGRNWGRNVWMVAFLGMIEIYRTPQLRQKCKAPSSITIQHNAQVFWKRRWQWLLLGNLQMPVTAMEMVSQQTEWYPLGCSGGVGFPWLEPLEASVPAHSSSISTKTDSWASPQATDSESPRGRGCLSSTTGDSCHQASFESSLSP